MNNMDPDCAICSHPAITQCECEATALDKAVQQAETRMMAGVFTEIRSWVRAHAQDYILSLFTQLTTHRKTQHAATITRITDRAYHYHGLPPHPSEIIAAEAELKRGIDDDWKASVQRYPEVLEYFYSLVDLSLPGDEEMRVSDPPLSALNGGKGRVRIRERPAPIRERERRRSRERSRRGVQFAPMPEFGYVAAPRY